MADLRALQLELEQTQKQIREALQAKIKAESEAQEAAILAAEASKTDADKAAELQAQIDEAKKYLLEMQSFHLKQTAMPLHLQFLEMLPPQQTEQLLLET
jgi:hypothetical protein